MSTGKVLAVCLKGLEESAFASHSYPQVQSQIVNSYLKLLVNGQNTLGT